MFCYIKRLKKIIVSTLGVLLFFTTQLFGIELNMYYPVAVGGSLTKIVDGMVDEFEKKNPDVKVNAIYAGNYNDARIKALAALKSGKPAQLSVMFSIDIYELIEQDAIVPFDDLVSTYEDKAWLYSFLNLAPFGRTCSRIHLNPVHPVNPVKKIRQDKTGYQPC